MTCLFLVLDDYDLYMVFFGLYSAATYNPKNMVSKSQRRSNGNLIRFRVRAPIESDRRPEYWTIVFPAMHTRGQLEE